MHRLVRAATLAAAALLAVSATAGTARAVGTGLPVIVSPAANTQLPSNWTGPVTLDMSHAPTGGYRVRVSCPYTGNWMDFSSWEQNFTYDGSQDTYQFTVDKPVQFDQPNTCTVAVNDTTNGLINVTESVRSAPTPLRFQQLEQTDTTIYPHVRDGYLDTTSVDYQLDQQATTTGVVKDATGHVVRTQQVATTPDRLGTWTWNGRDDTGAVVPNGTYTLELTGTSLWGQTTTAAAPTPVVVTTGTQTLTGHTVRYGTDGYPTASRGCRVYRFPDRSVTPTCRGGKFAFVTWKVKVPATATLRYFAVNLGVAQGPKPSILDDCCKGTISQSLVRTDATHFRARVKVTRWRAKDVYRIDLGYRYRKAI